MAVKVSHTLGIFDPSKSNRANILYQAIEPYLSNEKSILDVGCGTAPLAHFFAQKYPKVSYFGFDNHGQIIAGLANQYKKFTFRRVQYKEGNIKFIKHRYNIIIHIGLDCWEWTPIWGIHNAMLERPKLHPDHVLLETGYRLGYMGCYESYERVQEAYKEHDYTIKDEGIFAFDVDNHHLKNRVWCVLEK